VTISTREEFEEWLKTQPREVCVAIAYRAAMRVLPLAATAPDERKTWSDLALAALRTSFKIGVLAARPTAELRNVTRAADGSAFRAAVRAAGSSDYTNPVADNAYDVAVLAAGVAAAAAGAAYAADAAGATAAAARYTVGTIAGIPDGDTSAAATATNLYAYLASAISPRRAIAFPPELAEAIAHRAKGRMNLLASGGPWSFWAEWYARAMAGDPLPWDLQETIALIPDDIWEAGPEAVAERIREIEEEYWAEALPQAETIFLGADGRFDVRPDATPADDALERMLKQVDFSLGLALRTNCGFTEMCVAFQYLRHTLENCRDDPNAIEQNFRQARDILKRKIDVKEYDQHDALLALIDGLDQHALQLRGSHPEVRRAYEIRIQQKLRETDDKTLAMVAGGMRAFQREKTKGRLSTETALDADTVEQDSGVEAQATAIQRTGGRAAQARLIERASRSAKNVHDSGGYKAADTAATGWSIVEMLKSVFGA
jgi:hypothetical protein